MASAKRLSLPGEIHHIISRCIDGKFLFADNNDCIKFGTILQKRLSKTGFSCIYWGINHTHFHLIIRITNRPLSFLMQSLNSTYAKYLNKRYKSHDTVFAKFSSVAVQNEYLEILSSIIKDDSFLVGAGDDLLNLKSYDLNNNHASIDLVNESKFARQYKRKANHDNDTKLQFKNQIIDKVINCILNKENHHDHFCYILGDESFVAKASRKLKEMQVLANYKISGWTLEHLANFVTSHLAISISELMKRGRLDKRSKARQLFAYLSTWVQGYSLAQTARFLHISGCAVSNLAQKGFSIFANQQLDFPENPPVPIADLV